MRQFRLTLPDELFDAAKIEGVSEHYIFVRIVVPLVVVLSSGFMKTLPLRIAAMMDETFVEYGMLTAGIAMSAVKG